MTTESILFQPFNSDKLALENRIVMAPMTRSQSPGGIPDAAVAAYYRRRAENHVGLIITEGTLINDPATRLPNNVPVFYGDALPGWQTVVDAVHTVGGKIAPQLWHLGMTRSAIPSLDVSDLAPSVGPSGLLHNGDRRAEPMTQQQIDLVVRGFAQAAAEAKRLGFDAVEIHGAHGYLIDQFFWEKTNRRNDVYGGNLVKRTRFAVEIIEAVRAAVGPRFPIIFRFSQWKDGFYDAKLATNPAELDQFLMPLVNAGVDIFDCSTRRFWEPEFTDSDLNLAGWTKKISGKPTISVGSVGLMSAFAGIQREASQRRGIDDLLERMQRNEFDLIAVGRALLADAEWARKIRENRQNELRDFSPEAYKTLD
jgi:2,4-dienoyl-CoA reductase-like NADH-dependent reductase (Old Yellow Enzyme family)